jgi:peptidyl-prolyl cis-trans isomerase SurA
MKKLLILLILALPAIHGYCENISKVIARVNNQVITSKDLDDYCKMVQYRFPDDTVNYTSDKKRVKEELLQNLVEDRLILDKAKKDDLSIQPDLISAKLQEMISTYPSREEFENSLIERGVTVSTLKDKIKEQFLVRQIIDKYVKSDVTVSPQEISRYYKDHAADIATPQTYVLWIAQSKSKDTLDAIAATIKEKGIEKATAENESLLLRVEAPVDQLKEEIASVVKNLKEKEYSVQGTGDTVYLVYLEKIVPAHALSLDEAQDKIRAMIWKNKFQARFREWVNELREKATIETYPL